MGQHYGLLVANHPPTHLPTQTLTNTLTHVRGIHYYCLTILLSYFNHKHTTPFITTPTCCTEHDCTKQHSYTLHKTNYYTKHTLDTHTHTDTLLTSTQAGNQHVSKRYLILYPFLLLHLAPPPSEVQQFHTT